MSKGTPQNKRPDPPERPQPPPNREVRDGSSTPRPTSDGSNLASNIGKFPSIISAFKDLLINAAKHQGTGCVRITVNFTNGKPTKYQKTSDFPTITNTDITDEE